MSPTLTTPVTTPTSDDLFGGWCRPRHAQEAVVEAMTRRYIRGLGVVDDRDVMRIAETVAERCDGLDGAALRERVARVLAETCLGRVTGPAAGPELRTARRIDARQVEAVPASAANPMRRQRIRRSWRSRTRAALRQLRVRLRLAAAG